ncbi:hypothetical protein PG985_013520 [Apiospora marii]|uniref:Heterokaryon incompatibility domain-containing protein n=1 Tax=Apiospora marii TaxID=335849 RepID=A0ABR1R9I9_9PEZI
MQDDTGKDIPALDPNAIDKVKSLWKFRVDRLKCQEWAFLDMKFLVYDDTDDDNFDSRKHQVQARARSVNVPENLPKTLHQSPSRRYDDIELQQAILESLNTGPPTNQQDQNAEANSPKRPGDDFQDDDTDDSQLRKAIRLSLKNDNDSADVHGESSTSQTDPHLRDPPLSVHTNFQCKICSSIPTFPHDKRTRKFRLFKPADELPELVHKDSIAADICNHYVAVSYCWPEPLKDDDGNVVKTKTESKARDLNGLSRPARALDDVLDRAVDFANSFGLRMIWIDQECLPQPQDNSPEEEETYQKLGVQAMDIVYNRAAVTAGLHSATITSQSEADAIKHLITCGNDFASYYYSKPSMQMLERVLHFLEKVTSDRWYTRAWVLQEATSAGSGLFLVFRREPGIVYTEKYRPSSDSEHRDVPPHPLDTEERGMQTEIVAIPVRDFRAIVRAAKALLEGHSESTGQPLALASSRFPILSKAEALHTRTTVQPNTVVFNLRGKRAYGGRETVDAATALTLLKTRHCRDVQDRITILANMCSYELRLDTVEVARNCESLRLGMLAVALLNSDTSMLIPELYMFPGGDDWDPDLSTDRRAGQLLSPFDLEPSLIDHYAVKNRNLVTPRPYNSSRYDDNSEGLPLVSYLWTVKDTIDLMPLKEQYAEAWHSMKCLDFAMVRQDGESQVDFETRKRSIMHHFTNGDNLRAAQEGILHHRGFAIDSAAWGGLDVRGFQTRAHLDARRVEMNTGMRRLVANILFAILRYLHDLATPQAAGVANSIWQSIRVDIVPERTINSQIMADLPDVVSEELFAHPDVLREAFEVLQLDKSRGGTYHQVWLVDRVMRDGMLWYGTYNRPKRNVPPLSSNLERESNMTTNTGGITTNPVGPTDNQSSTPAQPMPKSILQRQLSRRILAALSSVFIDCPEGNEKVKPELLVAGNYAYFYETVVEGIWDNDREDARVRDLASVFDVDGPCTVATLFNPDWEILPRPACRSMSVCWVVDSIQHGDAMVSQHEQEQVVSQGQVKGKEPEHAPSISQSASAEGGQPKADLDGGKRSFRVVKKVRGMWQIMDLPIQSYWFL